jgi:hypothetical protein
MYKKYLIIDYIMTSFFKKLGNGFSSFFSKHTGHAIVAGLKGASSVISDPMISTALMGATAVAAPELLPVTSGLIAGSSAFSRSKLI